MRGFSSKNESVQARNLKQELVQLYGRGEEFGQFLGQQHRRHVDEGGGVRDSDERPPAARASAGWRCRWWNKVVLKPDS